MATTLKHIAQKAGVSVTTVSRILNGRESGLPIRDETRQRVLAVALELGYKPNLLARGLRGSHSSLLGVIVRDITEPFFAQIVKGINAAAIQRGNRLFLGHVERQPDTTIDYGSMFEQSHADGILIIGDMQDDAQAVQYLTEHHHYVVGVTDRTHRRAFPGVYTDSEMGTRLAMEHLWELGHRCILCVSDPSISDGTLRVATYERFMQEHHAEEHISVLLTTRSPEGGLEIGQRIFAQPDDLPTAIFAATDTLAIGLIQAAYEARIAIPDQVSIIGYDDIDMARFTIPPLTTISQSGFTMGYTATNLILDMIEQQANAADTADIVLPSTLVVRQSTGAVQS
jgi:DNA-binding LacI/PurR family transcriptional regulator